MGHMVLVLCSNSSVALADMNYTRHTQKRDEFRVKVTVAGNVISGLFQHVGTVLNFSRARDFDICFSYPARF